jgi:hypothetical protein
LVGMTPILAQLLACTGRKMEQGRKIIPYQKRSKVGGERGLIGLLCSQRAHDKNVLPRCAQWETDSGLPPGEDTSERGGAIGDKGLG